MENWRALSSQEYDEVWERVYRDFKFWPSVSDFPSFEVPSPFITYDISNYFKDHVDSDAYENLEEKTLAAFKAISSIDESILALDWQHQGYWVNPYLEFSRDEFEEWIIPIFPNGDYYFFLQQDFNWGFLGHPWEKSITIFGEELLNALTEYKPIMLQKILRQG